MDNVLVAVVVAVGGWGGGREDGVVTRWRRLETWRREVRLVDGRCSCCPGKRGGVRGVWERGQSCLCEVAVFRVGSGSADSSAFSSAVFVLFPEAVKNASNLPKKRASFASFHYRRILVWNKSCFSPYPFHFYFAKLPDAADERGRFHRDDAPI